MLTATLGGLIKDYRLKKRLSQLEVSMHIGWSDTTRLSKIEQGRVAKPSIEVIEKIMDALDLTAIERGEFLLVGGYQPTEQEIKSILKEHKERISKWPYPAHLLDFSGRILYMNDEEYKMAQATEDLKKAISNRVHPLEWAFMDKPLWKTIIKKGDSVDNLKSYQLSKIINFKIRQSGRESEKWYKQLIKKLSVNKVFRDIWSSTNVKGDTQKFYDYEFKEFVISPKKKIQYHAFSTRIVNDVRFAIVFYVPAKAQIDL